MAKQRPIMHVEIVDNDGKQLADIDGASTADALAYYLRSRRIDPDATEQSIRKAVDASTPDTAEITYESRHPITGVLESAYQARVH